MSCVIQGSENVSACWAAYIPELTYLCWANISRCYQSNSFPINLCWWCFQRLGLQQTEAAWSNFGYFFVVLFDILRQVSIYLSFGLKLLKCFVAHETSSNFLLARGWADDDFNFLMCRSFNTFPTSMAPVVWQPVTAALGHLRAFSSSFQTPFYIF